jgi:hypothetical protein
MSMLFAALISFLSIALIVSHFSAHTVRRFVGYAKWVDIALHLTVFAMFIGTSTMGLLQAEAAAIMFSIGLRTYRWLFGYEVLTMKGWVRYAGVLTRVAA